MVRCFVRRKRLQFVGKGNLELFVILDQNDAFDRVHGFVSLFYKRSELEVDRNFVSAEMNSLFRPKFTENTEST